MTGLYDEFISVYRDEGIAKAVNWAARNIIISGSQARTYAFVDTFSPFFLKRDGLERRLQDNGTIEYYGKQRDCDIQLPDGTDHPEIIVERSGTYPISQPFVGELKNVNLVGSYPIPINQYREIVLESVVSPPVFALNVAFSLRDALHYPKRTPTRRCPSSIDCAVLLYNRWNRGYYHWTAEALTRLEGVEKYEERTGTRPKIIVGPELNRFQRQSLELLGYGQEDLIQWDRWNGSVDRFVVPSMRRELNLGMTSPVAYWWLREKMRANAADQASDAIDDSSKRIYISREDAPRRRVVNEDAVLQVLRKHGFEKYVLSERSVAENVNLFAQADVIVGPHGAGLTDIIYSDDATVIELFRSNDVRPTYYVLSEQLGHQYRYLLCDYEGPNLVVNTSDLEDMIHQKVEL